MAAHGRCLLCRGALAAPAAAVAARLRPAAAAAAATRARAPLPPPQPAPLLLLQRAPRRAAAAPRRGWCSAAAGGVTSSAVAATSAGAPLPRKGRVVFLGTPDVAARVLAALFDAAAAPDACFELAGVVSQPGKPRGRGRGRNGGDDAAAAAAAPSPVAALALARGLPPAALLTPASAREPAFLEALQARPSRRERHTHACQNPLYPR
jgi:hypothetical protein